MQALSAHRACIIISVFSETSQGETARYHLAPRAHTPRARARDGAGREDRARDGAWRVLRAYVAGTGESGDGVGWMEESSEPLLRCRTVTVCVRKG